jgi:hypothetical protein
MQFQVPQFIEVEDQVFGKLTIRQFIYLAGGAGLDVLLYFTLPLFIAIFFMAPITIFAIALAFYKINNKPFIYMLEAFVMYTVRNKLYIWKKESRRIEQKKTEDDVLAPLLAPKLSDSRLKDLAWSLDVTDKLSGGTEKKRNSVF